MELLAELDGETIAGIEGLLAAEVERATRELVLTTDDHRFHQGKVKALVSIRDNVRTEWSALHKAQRS